MRLVVFSIMMELSGRTYMLRHVDVGQAVQAEDVALLSVLVDTIEGQTCRSQCRRVRTGALPWASLLHWCTMDVYTSPRKQQ